MTDTGQAERDLWDWCNRARAAAGLPPLCPCPALTAAARAKCAEIAGGEVRHAGRHAGPLQLQRAHGVRARTMGAENLAAYRDHWSAFQALMHSPGHRDNILHPEHQRLGLAVQPHQSGGVAVCMEFAGG